MALSEDSLLQPVKDLLLGRFGTAADTRIVFRFDKFGSVLTEDDFVLDSRPDLGHSSALAAEMFSDLVNRTRVDLGDGLNVAFSESDLDNSYFYRRCRRRCHTCRPRSTQS